MKPHRLKSYSRPMLRYVLAATLVYLAGCTTVPEHVHQRPNETIVVKESPELIELINTLLEVQKDTTEDVKVELERTRATLSKISQAKPNDGEQAQINAPKSISKWEWLESEGKILVGSVEQIMLSNENIRYGARIDTGATSSSIDARDVTRFERDGDRWVRFKLFNAGEFVAEIERPVIRWVRVFQSDNQDGSRRPVVEMAYELGEFKDTAEFTLTDRSHLEYPVLIGRNIITDRMLVDVSDSFIHGNNK